MVCFTPSELAFRKHVCTSASSGLSHGLSLAGDAEVAILIKLITELLGCGRSLGIHLGTRSQEGICIPKKCVV